MSAASFLLPPQPLTQRQRVVFWAAAALVAATRLWALSRTMWEWDEALFALAVRDFDVVDHRPHPPGFPLHIGAAKLVRLLIASDFRALQAVTLLGALLLLPATFMLARELRFSFATSLLGSILYVFAPNVWYYGGTAFSDIPATTAVIAANALLLKGCRDGRAYLIGALLLGVSIGFRPQLLLSAVVSLSLSTFFQWRRSRRRVAAAMSIVIVVVAVSYGAAAVASSRGYLDVVVAQSRYVGSVDSFLNPTRPWLETLVRSFFIKAIRAPRIVVFFIGLFGLIAVVVSLRRRAVNVLLLILIFAPLNVFSWLMLDIGAASRYAVAYAALYALLAAEGAGIVSSPLRSSRAQTIAQAVLVLSLTAQMILWAAPSIHLVRTTPSPPAAAMEWLTTHVPANARIHMYAGLRPLATYYLQGYDVVLFPPMLPLPSVTLDRAHYYVRDVPSPYPGSSNFAYPRDPLWEVARARYFATSVLPLEVLLRFGDGWFDLETDGTNVWRWMGRRGVITLAPMQAPATLMLQYRVPARAASRNPTVTITVNDEVVARRSVKEGMNETSTIVMSKRDRPNEVVVEIDRTIAPVETGDSRELGLQLYSWSWSPLPAASAR